MRLPEGHAKPRVSFTAACRMSQARGHLQNPQATLLGSLGSEDAPQKPRPEPGPRAAGRRQHAGDLCSQLVAPAAAASLEGAQQPRPAQPCLGTRARVQVLAPAPEAASDLAVLCVCHPAPRGSGRKWPGLHTEAALWLHKHSMTRPGCRQVHGPLQGPGGSGASPRQPWAVPQSQVTASPEERKETETEGAATTRHRQAPGPRSQGQPTRALQRHRHAESRGSLRKFRALNSGAEAMTHSLIQTLAARLLGDQEPRMPDAGMHTCNLSFCCSGG